MPDFILRPHPATPCKPIESVSVRVDWVSDDLLVLYYRIVGAIDVIRLPPQRRSAHADDLWKSTCCEAFLQAPGERGYFELNFSPSSEWAIYRFDEYRRGMQALEPARAPKVLWRRHNDALDADVDVHLGALGLPRTGDLQLGLAAVLQDQDGALTYWALAHPEGKPDFHHSHGFAATLARPASDA